MDLQEEIAHIRDRLRAYHSVPCPKQNYGGYDPICNGRIYDTGEEVSEPDTFARSVAVQRAAELYSSTRSDDLGKILRGIYHDGQFLADHERKGSWSGLLDRRAERESRAIAGRALGYNPIAVWMRIHPVKVGLAAAALVAIVHAIADHLGG